MSLRPLLSCCLPARRAGFVLALLGALLLTGCDGGDPPQQRLQTTQQGGVFSIALDPTGQLVVVGSKHDGNSVWRIQSGQQLFLWQGTGSGDDIAPQRAAAFSPDGGFVITGEREGVMLRELTRGEGMRAWPTLGQVNSVALSTAGRRALVGLANNMAVLFDNFGQIGESGIRHADAINRVEISADGRLGITATNDYMLRAWDLDQGQAVMTQKFQAPITATALSADAELVYVSQSRFPDEIWHIPSRRLLGRLGKPREAAISARFSSDNSMLLTGTAAGVVHLWAVNNGDLMRTWQVPKDMIYPPATGRAVLDVAFGPGNATVIAAMSSGDVLVWPRR